MMNNKVIILTHGLDHNYGGILQSYALQKVISEMGYDVVTDRYACRNEVKSWKRYLTWLYYPIIELFGKKPLTRKRREYINKNISGFIEKYIKTTDFFHGKASPRQSDINKYDIYIVGSDQIWRNSYVRVQSYFLDFLKERTDKLRIAYAGSFGVDNLNEWSISDVEKCKVLSKRFDAISVREDSGVEIFRKEFDMDVTHVIDPTLLLPSDNYLRLDGIESIKQNSDLFYCYILDPTAKKKNITDKIKEQFNISNSLSISPQEYNKNINNIEEYVYPSVSKWLSGFRDAKFVFTDSFHGVVFSILFNKQFVCYENPDRGNTRIISLLNMFGIRDRLISSISDIDKVIDNRINYDKINEILNMKRNESLEFLYLALRTK